MGQRQYIYIFVFALFGSLQSECGYAAQTTQITVTPAPIAFAPVESWPARSVPAWLDYCVRHSDDCQTDLRQPVKVTLTPQLLKKLKAVNSAVNGQVRPLSDLEHWGVKDHWDQAEDGYGDCEDYQLLKRKQLVDEGVPRRTMLMTVAWDAQHEGHALLMIRTNVGDLILDNERDEISLWKDTGYQFVKRESQYATGWVAIAAPVGTASID